MLPDTFWNKVNIPKDTELCWEWMGSKVGGYGHYRVKDKIKKAHRLSYEHFYGAVPDKLMVCHKCDNRCCVNPNHLFTGTAADNAFDRDTKDRFVKLIGEKHGMSKLTNEAVVEIKKVAKRFHEERKQLANKYNVGVTTIHDVMNNRTWAWLDK